MRLRFMSILVLVLTVHAIAASAQDGRAIVAAAVTAMGAESLKTVTLTGSGSLTGVGQNVSATEPWPLAQLKRYSRTIDVEMPASSFEGVRLQNGAEGRIGQVVATTTAWANRFDLWITTPYPFLKAATTQPVTVGSEVVNQTRYTVVTINVDGKYPVAGYISEKNVVERLRTRVDNDVLGDMLVEAVFSGYREFAGLQVPTLTIVKQGGFPTMIAGVADAKVNLPVTMPAAPPPTSQPAVVVTAERVTDGVTYLKGGSHHSVVVEFADHVTLIEAPQNEARALALLAEIRKRYPAKPLTQVVNSHHHFDHAGGLRTFVDAGATILTHQSNVAFYQEAFKSPRTLNPDRLARSKRAATITGVGDKLVLSDATRTVELHHLAGNPHDQGMLVAFLPRERLLVEVDMYTPPAADTPRPAADAAVNPNAVALVDNLERLRLDFQTILPLHGATVATRANLYEFVRKPLVPVSELRDPDPGFRSRGGRGGDPLPPPDLTPSPAAPAPTTPAPATPSLAAPAAGAATRQ